MRAGRSSRTMCDRSGAEQVVHELGRLLQRDQVATGKHVRLEAETIPGERLLEAEWKEAVVSSGHDPDRDRGPDAPHRAQAAAGPRAALGVDVR